MKIELSTSLATALPADWLVVGAWQNDDAMPAAAGSAAVELISQLRSSKDFEGKLLELLPLHQAAGLSHRRVLLIGLGEPKKFGARQATRVGAAIAKFIASKQGGAIVLSIEPFAVSTLPTATVVERLVVGLHQGSEGSDVMKSEPALRALTTITLVGPVDAAERMLEGLEVGQVVGDAINLARRLVNLPPDQIYPESFCLRAQQLAAAVGVDCEILEPQRLAELRMNALLGVGKGSERLPRLLILRHRVTNDPQCRPLCFVGKGITFDSGGLSIKTADGMIDMKADMSGAASVLAAILACARLKVDRPILALAPLAENMPSGSAYRPGDILKARNGKTIHIVNTDAEGRLVLADALCYAVELGASRIVDLATLTGACVVALGMNVSGVMSNHDDWQEQVLHAAETVGELAWPLPMYDVYDELIKTDVADMKNSGGRWGGAITAAKLLAQFVGDVPWTHVDIAGPAFAEKESTAAHAGGAGVFVATLVQLARQASP